MKILQRIIGVALRFIAIALGSYLFWSLGPAGICVLLFAVGLAIAGPANWWRWTAVFATTAAAIGSTLALASSYLHLPDGFDVVFGIIACGVLPLVPASLLWVAHRLRLRTARLPT